MKTAFVMSGGGSRGSYEIGVWQAMRRAGIKADLVCGTSVGAINAAMVVLGNADKAASLWKNLETDMIFDSGTDGGEYAEKLEKVVESIYKFGESHSNVEMTAGRVGNALERKGMRLAETFNEKTGISIDEALGYAKEIIIGRGMGSSGLLEILKKYIPAKKFYRSKVDYGMVTCSYPDFKGQTFYKAEIPPELLHEYIVASASCFPAARYAEIGGKKFVDGGYADNMPVSMALEQKAERIIAVDLKSVGKTDRTSIAEAEKMNERFTLIEPVWSTGNFLLFEPEQTEINLRMGYLDGMKAFGRLDGLRYTFRKGSLAEDVLLDADAAAYVFKLDPKKIYTEKTLAKALRPEILKTQVELKRSGIIPGQVLSGLQFSAADLARKISALKKTYASEALAVFAAESMLDKGKNSTHPGRYADRLVTDEMGAARYIAQNDMLF